MNKHFVNRLVFPNCRGINELKIYEIADVLRGEGDEDDEDSSSSSSSSLCLFLCSFV